MSKSLTMSSAKRLTLLKWAAPIVVVESMTNTISAAFPIHSAKIISFGALNLKFASLYS
jgi:hypothetical protein